MAFLADLQKFSKEKLAPTETRVRLRDGTTIVEKNGTAQGSTKNRLSIFVDYRSADDFLEDLIEGSISLEVDSTESISQVAFG